VGPVDPKVKQYVEEMLRAGYSLNSIYRSCPPGSISQTTIGRIRGQIGAQFSPALFGVSPPPFHEWLARQQDAPSESEAPPRAKKPEREKPTARRESVVHDVLTALRSSQVVAIRDLGLSEREAQEIAEELYRQQYAIEFDAESGVFRLHSRPSLATAGNIVRPVERGARILKIGLVSDTHLCSHYERLDVLRELYRIFKSEGIREVYHCGNIIDGRERFNQFEVKYWALDDQVKYLIDNYPAESGITTYFITADHHEGWWQEREGIDVGRKIMSDAREMGRQDLVHIGYVEADVILETAGGRSVMRLFHPRDGSAYAISYRPQKIVESYQGGMKPRVLLLGHYHKFGVTYTRDVYVVQAGCTQDQTRFMRNKAIAAHVGGCILFFVQDTENGVLTRFQVEWIPFFDREFEERRLRDDR
jgi:predicted phosphodiesterase